MVRWEEWVLVQRERKRVLGCFGRLARVGLPVRGLRTGLGQRESVERGVVEVVTTGKYSNSTIACCVDSGIVDGLSQREQSYGIWLRDCVVAPNVKSALHPGFKVPVDSSVCSGEMCLVSSDTCSINMTGPTVWPQNGLRNGLQQVQTTQAGSSPLLGLAGPRYPS